jgi:hypothetical protein
MRRQITSLLLIATLAMISWVSAQTGRTEIYDVKKARQELEVMRGILGTTTSFIARELRAKEEAPKATAGSTYRSRGDEYGLGERNIFAFYLYGQGATFVIPAGSIARHAHGGAYAVTGGGAGFDMADLEGEMADFKMQMEEGQYQAALAAYEVSKEIARSAQESARAAAEATRAAGVQVPPAPPAPPAAVQAPQPPVPPTPPPSTGKGKTISQEEMRKKVAEAQEKMKQRREEAEERRRKLLESIEQAKGPLIEALANHADSLTFLRPNEYVNIIITTGSGFEFFRDSEAGDDRQVLSIQKSWATDYKAGRLSLDAFKQKVLQYNN